MVIGNVAVGIREREERESSECYEEEKRYRRKEEESILLKTLFSIKDAEVICLPCQPDRCNNCNVKVGSLARNGLDEEGAIVCLSKRRRNLCTDDNIYSVRSLSERLAEGNLILNNIEGKVLFESIETTNLDKKCDRCNKRTSALLASRWDGERVICFDPDCYDKLIIKVYGGEN